MKDINWKVTLATIVAALGYFVDIYDLTIFSVVRVPSLESLGLSGDALLTAGIKVLNWQMAGMLVGGLVWGILGDKLGRTKVLFGSIILYSLSSIANSYVTDVDTYALLRFITGVGLAGEVGAGITLVSELMSISTRGYSTTIIATAGGAGGVLAGIVGSQFPWRTAMFIGGVLGLLLLVFRVLVHESGMFEAIKSNSQIKRGNFFMLLYPRERLIRYLSCLVIGIPVWYMIAILVVFGPELARSLSVTGEIKGPTNVLLWSIGITTGDLLSGFTSQLIKSRKRVLKLFITLGLIFSTLILSWKGMSTFQFYSLSFLIGFSTGYWAVFLTTAAENFGTNLRVTVSSTVPNFVRGSSVLITLASGLLKPELGFVSAAIVVGIVVFSISFLALWHLKETYGADLDFVEKN